MSTSFTDVSEYCSAC